jgi:hypothetical protein
MGSLRARRVYPKRAKLRRLACRSGLLSFVVPLRHPWTEETSVKYLTFVRHPEKYRESRPPQTLMEAMGRFVEKSLKDGVLVDTGGLLPSRDGVRVRLANGKITVTDGPFSESKEVIGGWAILKTDSKAEAVRIAKEFMELHLAHWPGFEGESELRPMFEPGEGP